MKDTLLVLALAGLAAAHGHEPHHAHRALLPRLSRATEQEADLHRLFRRQSGNYPVADKPGPAPLPAWTAAYQRAKAAGLIPAIPNSVNRGGNPVYPSGTNPNDMKNVCSWTYTNCNATTDIVNAPDGMIGISFDDGPQPAAGPLYTFLNANNIPSTHFMIGSRILDNPALFRTALQLEQASLAVHTWSHPLMTTMTDAQVLGELGWCMQIIYDNSGGLLPQFWRPPYGDVDNRVRAIAQQVFGLTTVIWNKDTDDWCMNDDGTNACPNNPQAPASDRALANELTTYLSGPKSPGLIILEHEHKVRAVAGFMNTAWPLIQSQGWKYDNIPSLFNLQYYQNAATNNATIQSGAVAINAVTSAVPLAAGAIPAAATITSGRSGLSGAATAARTLAAVSGSGASMASQSAGNLAAVVANGAQANVATQKFSTAAKIGIIAGSAAGVALIAVLIACICIRRRRKARAVRAGPDVRTHPYNDMMESKSSLTIDSKAPSPTKVAPVLLYGQPADTRKSAVSLYSTQDAGGALDSYFARSESPPRSATQAERPQTQRFHLPTSAVRTSPPTTTNLQPPRERAGWL